MKFIKELVPYVIIVLVVVLIRTYIVTPAIVNGDSMVDTLHDNELVLVNKIDLSLNGIERFDIVVIDYNDEKIIKRVIGLPKEKIEYKSNKLFINDKEMELPMDFENTKDFTTELVENEYYVLGDNRDISKDSRIIGPIDITDIKGTVNFVLFPFSKFGKIN